MSFTIVRMTAPLGNPIGAAPRCAAARRSVAGLTRLRPAPAPSKPMTRRRLMRTEGHVVISTSLWVSGAHVEAGLTNHGPFRDVVCNPDLEPEVAFGKRRERDAQATRQLVSGSEIELPRQ